MVATELDVKFLEPQHLDVAALSPTSSTDELGAAAAAELAAITADERSVTARYWLMGQFLTWARKPLTHGQWGQFLKQWNIDKTRAAKAMRIFQGFPTAAATADLTVAEAYARSAKPFSGSATPQKLKKAKKSQTAAAATSVPDTIQSWTKFADAMTIVVERQLEEPEFLTPAEAVAALASLNRLLAALQQCEARLRDRTAESVS